MAQPAHKIAFVSPHCVLDFTNGAATATRDGLRVLIEQGFECRAYCGTRLDEPQEGLLQESLFRRGVRYEVRNVRIPVPGTAGRETRGHGGRETGGHGDKETGGHGDKE